MYLKANKNRSTPSKIVGLSETTSSNSKISMKRLLQPRSKISNNLMLFFKEIEKEQTGHGSRKKEQYR